MALENKRRDVGRDVAGAGADWISMTLDQRMRPERSVQSTAGLSVVQIAGSPQQKTAESSPRLSGLPMGCEWPDVVQFRIRERRVGAAVAGVLENSGGLGGVSLAHGLDLDRVIRMWCSNASSQHLDRILPASAERCTESSLLPEPHVGFVVETSDYGE